MPIHYNWQKLSPHDFAQLQELTCSSPRRLKDVLRELDAGGSLAQLSPVEPTDFDGFRKFLEAFLGPEVPDAVCKHLFLSLVPRPADAVDYDALVSLTPGERASANASRSATLTKATASSCIRRNAAESNVNSVTAAASRIWQRLASLSHPTLHALGVNNPTSASASASASTSLSSSLVVRAAHCDAPDRAALKRSSNGSGSGVNADADATPTDHRRSFHNLQAFRVTNSNRSSRSSGKERERRSSNPNVNAIRIERQISANQCPHTQSLLPEADRERERDRECTCTGCPLAALACASNLCNSTSVSITASTHRNSQQPGPLGGSGSFSGSTNGGGTLSFARWWRLRERDKERQRVSVLVSAAYYAELLKQELEELEHGRIYLKDLICYLSLLEAATPYEKLEFCFRLYDADSNGVLDSHEIECIVNQMMAVAEYLGWDVSELRPILEEMMGEIDLDSDGSVSLDEWIRGGLTTIPLLVLLGIDEAVREDGVHVWRLKHFQRQTVCNVCRAALGGLRKQGLCCTYCKYSVHQRCAQTAAQNCIRTYTKSRRELSAPMAHHWVESNYPGKCDRCSKSIRHTSHASTALRCRWCQLTIHDKCKPSVKNECDFGRLRELILPPTAVLPGVLERRGMQAKRSGELASASASAGALCAGASQQSLCSSATNSAATTPTGGGQMGGHSLAERVGSIGAAGGAPSSLHIQLEPGMHRPLFVFVNPKSGGRQGSRILRKLQCVMNPRQVFDMTRTGEPLAGLNFFRNVAACRVLCAGGDGTVGWLLDAMDRTEWTVGRPPVAVLPLGTGNDLARCLRWGGGYRDADSLTKLLDRVRLAEPLLLDRWHIELVEAPVTSEERERDAACESTDRSRRVSGTGTTDNDNETENERTSGVHSVSANESERERDRERLPETIDGEPTKQSDPIPSAIINNYFSIGLDASIAHRFHMMRERHPERFKSRMRNKVFYFEFATSEAFQGTCRNLHQFVDVECDGVPLDLAHGPPLEAITLVNIPSIYGGSNLWGTSNPSHRHRHRAAGVQFAQQDVGDRLIEVVGIESIFHTAQLKAGLRSSGRRLAQCHQVTIRTRKRFPMQVDGEPWMQAPCFINIRHKNQVPMLAAPKVERKLGGLLGWFGKKSSRRGDTNANAAGVSQDEPTNSASSSSASASVSVNGT